MVYVNCSGSFTENPASFGNILGTTERSELNEAIEMTSTIELTKKVLFPKCTKRRLRYTKRTSSCTLFGSGSLSTKASGSSISETPFCFHQ